jgi:hypothetical protein
MSDVLLLKILESQNDLSCIELDNFFGKAARSDGYKFIRERASVDVFHDQVKVLLICKGMINFRQEGACLVAD